MKYAIPITKKLQEQNESILRPPPDRDSAEWADQERILPPGSPEPGPWRTTRTPFMKPFLNACSNPIYETVVFVCGSQMGKTENVLNISGHRLTDGPFVPILFVFPTEKLARSMSNDRFDKMITSTDILWERLEKGHANKVMEKFFSGIRLGFSYAGSATELSSHPAGLVLIDEIDRMSDVSGEGDPYLLAKARTKNYTAAKVVITSTPTIEGASRIWILWEGGTKGRWAWPCIHCEKYFVPERELLKWNEKDDIETIRETAFVVCPNCGGKLETKHRHEMNRKGRFEYCIVSDKGYQNIGPETPKSKTASFWASGLASPWQTFGDIAATVQAAINTKNQGTIQGAINTYLGECYRYSGDAPKWEMVKAHKKDYQFGYAPNGTQLITCGVDVQKTCLYYVIRGYGYRGESWLIENGQVMGETTEDEVWSGLHEILTQKYSDIPISRCFIDSGYTPGSSGFVRPDNKIYIFCRLMMGLCYPTKGKDMQDKPVKASKIDLTVSGKTIKDGITLWHIDTDYFKRQIYVNINQGPELKHGWHVHLDITDEYCKQITAEECITLDNGRRKWISTRRDNHYLDCEVLCDAAAYSGKAYDLPNLEKRKKKKEKKIEKSKKDSFIKRNDGNFIRR